MERLSELRGHFHCGRFFWFRPAAALEFSKLFEFNSVRRRGDAVTPRQHNSTVPYIGAFQWPVCASSGDTGAREGRHPRTMTNIERAGQQFVMGASDDNVGPRRVYSRHYYLREPKACSRHAGSEITRNF